MHTKSMYKELVFYLEACESGSMFKNLPDDMGIFATTAANATQSSWGTYCPGFGGAATADVVDGVELKTCLGDLFATVSKGARPNGRARGGGGGGGGGGMLTWL